MLAQIHSFIRIVIYILTQHYSEMVIDRELETCVYIYIYIYTFYTMCGLFYILIMSIDIFELRVNCNILYFYFIFVSAGSTRGAKTRFTYIKASEPYTQSTQRNQS